MTNDVNPSYLNPPFINQPTSMKPAGQVSKIPLPSEKIVKPTEPDQFQSSNLKATVATDGKQKKSSQSSIILPLALGTVALIGLLGGCYLMANPKEAEKLKGKLEDGFNHFFKKPKKAETEVKQPSIDVTEQEVDPSKTIKDNGDDRRTLDDIGRNIDEEEPHVLITTPGIEIQQEKPSTLQLFTGVSKQTCIRLEKPAKEITMDDLEKIMKEKDKILKLSDHQPLKVAYHITEALTYLKLRNKGVYGG